MLIFNTRTEFLKTLNIGQVMKIKTLSICIITSVMILTSCTKEKGTFLKIDYSSKENWEYSVNYTSQGIFTQGDSITTKNTSINCSLAGNKALESDKLALKVKGIEIASDMFDDEVKQQLTKQLLKAEYSLLIQEGYPTFDTDKALPAGSFLEWDLYLQFSRLMPLLPTKAVEPGFTWERSLTLPLQTAVGNVPCEVYQNYTFDSLSTDNKIAYISWQFRYSAEQQFLDSVDFFKQIPVAGNGSGAVELDLKNKCIQRAEMDFKSPIATIGEVKVDWREHAVLK